ncbi:hypothetical protein, partial [Serratia marcescens]|uniref:hypothetical protein n=1 Tax=Serratia marcescens TaxID=615 RepID=UPI001F14D22B
GTINMQLVGLISGAIDSYAPLRKITPTDININIAIGAKYKTLTRLNRAKDKITEVIHLQITEDITAGIMEIIARI